jgi:hypothetical protein
MPEKTIVIYCGKCGKEITTDQTCYQISTGKFEGEDMLFRAERYDFNRYFHDKCLNIL